MKCIVTLGLRAVLGLDIAIAGLLVFAPSAAMAIPFPTPAFDCNVGCPGCVGQTELGCPGVGQCPTDCHCVGAGGGAYTCQNL